jgi:hypothetical protein
MVKIKMGQVRVLEFREVKTLETLLLRLPNRNLTGIHYSHLHNLLKTLVDIQLEEFLMVMIDLLVGLNSEEIINKDHIAPQTMQLLTKAILFLLVDKETEMHQEPLMDKVNKMLVTLLDQ